MPDLHSIEDSATLYVLGRLTEAERDEFEARLTQSAELRALARELEAGVLVTAMASPQRRAPQQVWQNIEKAVAEETKLRLMDLSLWFGWLRNGWAAAAACLVGWLLYALWAGRPGLHEVATTPLASQIHVQPGATPTDSERTNAGGAPQPRITAKAESRSPQTNPLVVARELGMLRSRNAELSNKVADISQVLTQQQAMLSEPDRLKFFQLRPGSEGDTGGSNAPVSPALQRALFLAMARELGWLGSQSGSNPTNLGGVDFVDLRPGTNNATGSTHSQSQPATEPAGTPEDLSLASAFTNTIPGFVSGTSAFVALDSSVVPSGSVLSFRDPASEAAYYYYLAEFHTQPTVVGFPLSMYSGGGVGGNVLFNGGMTMFVIPPGSSNAIPYLLPAPGLTPP